MRTTLTLDDDVAALLHAVQKERHLTLKQAVNDALRGGLLYLKDKKKIEASSKNATAVVSLGTCLLPNIDNVSEILEIVEGENHR